MLASHQQHHPHQQDHIAGDRLEMEWLPTLQGNWDHGSRDGRCLLTVSSPPWHWDAGGVVGAFPAKPAAP